MFTKLWSQVGAGFVETVEEEETLSDEEWEGADFQGADLEARVAVEVIERAWERRRVRHFSRMRARIERQIF